MIQGLRPPKTLVRLPAPTPGLLSQTPVKLEMMYLPNRLTPSTFNRVGLKSITKPKVTFEERQTRFTKK